MKKKKLVAGAALALIMTMMAGLPQMSANTESSHETTINGPQVLPPV